MDCRLTHYLHRYIEDWAENFRVCNLVGLVDFDCQLAIANFLFFFGGDNDGAVDGCEKPVELWIRVA